MFFQMEIQRYKERRERRELKYQTMKREISGGKKGWNKINKYIYIYIFLELCYSIILKLELYCSTIVKNFAIVRFTIL